MFTIAKYKNRWCVYDTRVCVYYFQEQRGKKAAQEYAEELNRFCGFDVQHQKELPENKEV